MVEDLLGLTEAQSEALFERMWVLDITMTEPFKDELHG